MKQRFKRLCSLLLTTALVVTSVPGMGNTVYASQTSDAQECELTTVEAQEELETVDTVMEETSKIEETFKNEETSKTEETLSEEESIEEVKETVTEEASETIEEEITEIFETLIDEQSSEAELTTVETEEPTSEEEIVEVFEDNNLEGEDTPYWDFNFTVIGTAEEQAEVLSQVKVQSVDGTQDLGMSVPIESYENFAFHVEVPEGYTIISAKNGTGYRIRMKKDFVNNNFTILQVYNGYDNPSIPLKFVIDKIQNKELYIEYPDTIESVEVLCNDTPVEVVNGRISVLNTDSIILNVKAKENQMVTATYESVNDTEPMTYEESSVSADGIYCYQIGRVVYDTNIVFSTTPGANINFDVDEGVGGYFYDADKDYYLSNDLNVRLKTGKTIDIYFELDESKFYSNKLEIKNIFADGTEEILEYSYEVEGDIYICQYAITKNATLSIKWIPKTECKLTFNSDELEVYKVRCEYDDEYYYYIEDPYSENEEVPIYAGATIYFAVLMNNEYKFEYVSPTGAAEDALEMISTRKVENEENYGTYYTYYIYKYQPQADTEMQVKATAKESYQVSLELDNTMAFIPYCGYDESYEYSEPWETRSVYEGNSIIFAIGCTEAYKLEYVSTTNNKENQLKKIGTAWDEQYENLYSVYKYTPTADTTIYTKAVAKQQYTLNFEYSDEVYIDSYSIGSTDDMNEYDLYEGNYSFFVRTRSGHENIKLESVTAVGSSGNSIDLKREYDLVEKAFYYTVPLTENITVTITTAEKQDCEVEFNTGNFSISDVTGTVANDENTYTIQEDDVISFNVIPDDGYDIEAVTITAGENEEQKLYPVKNGNTYSYAAKINSNSQINIATKQKTEYKVSFVSDNAIVTSENSKDVNGSYIAYENEPFIFTVSAEENYVIDKVYTTDNEVYKMYNPNTSETYYQLIPTKDTTIIIDSKSVSNNEISFVYDDEYGYGYDVDTISVWCNSGKTLDTVTDGKLTVPNEDIIWFDLSDDASKVVSVKCTNSSGETKPICRTVYNGEEGYCIGNVTEDVQITISPSSYYTINLSMSKFNEKFVPVNGMGELLQTVYVPCGEKFDFRVVTPNGYKIRRVWLKGKNQATINGSLDTGIYCIEPKNSDSIWGDVHVSSIRLANGELKFDYPSEDVSLKAYVGEKEISLVDNSIVLPSTKALTFKVKPLTDKLVSLSIDLQPESIEEDGTQVYVISNVNNYSDDPVIIYAKEYYTVNLQNENVNFLIKQYDSEADEWIWSETESPLKVAKDDKIDFRVKAKEGYLINKVSLADEKTGEIKKKYAYDEFEEYIDYEYYELTPSANVTINVDTEAIKYNTYNFVYNSEAADLFIGSVYEYDEEGCYINWTPYTSELKKESFNTQKVLFKLRTKAGYKVSSVKTNRENPDVYNGYDDDMEEAYYYLANTEDTTITITTEEIKSYNVTFKYGEGIENITIFDPDSWDEYYVGENGINLSNEHGYYIVPNKYYDDMESYTYNIVSVKANGEELKLKTWGEDEGSGYWLSSDFSENVEIVIETARNEAVVNTTTTELNGEESSCKLFRYIESENDEGEIVTSKLYLESGEKCYIYGRTAKYGVEVEEGYIISKVEFERNGKVQALTADEEGLYSIYYPLSRGLKGTLTVYTEEKNKPVETYTALPLSLVNEDGTLTEAVPENGVYSSDSGLKYAASVEGSINGKAVITKAEITAENGQAVSSVSISEDKKQAEISIAKEDEGKLLYVNLYAGEKSELVATYIIIVNKPNLIESIAIEGITDKKVSQEIDTVKSYKLNIKTAEAELPKIGVEVIPAKGYSADSVKAEIADGNLYITTSAMMAAENIAVIKIYEEAKYKNSYIEGGTFTVSAAAPSMLINTDVQAEIVKRYDTALNLNVHVPRGLNELVTGKYYYKAEVTPLGTDIPEEIVRATEKPQYFEKKPYDYQEISVVVNDKPFGEGKAWKYDISVSLVQTNGKDFAEDAQNILYESKKAKLSNLETLEPHFTENITFYEIEKQIYTGQRSVAVAEFELDAKTSYPDIEKAEDITELDGKGSALHVYLDDDLIFVNVPKDAMIGKHTIEITVGGPASIGKTKGTYEVNVVKGIETLQLTVPSVSVYKPSNKAVTIKPVLTINQGTAAPKSKAVKWEAVKANGEAFVQGDALYGNITLNKGKVTVSKDFVPSETVSDNQFRIKVTAQDYESGDVHCISDVITLTNQPAEIGAVYVLAPTEGGYKIAVKNGSSITTDKLDNAFVAVLKKGAEEKELYTEEELKGLMLSPEILTYKASNKALIVNNSDNDSDKVTLSATKAVKNVKLTVSTNDGGKKKADLKFTVLYSTPEALALEVLKNNEIIGEAASKDVKFAGTTNTRLILKVKEKSGEGWTDLQAMPNYKLSMKNGKILSSDNANGIYEIIVTSKTATVTLDNKTTGKTSKEVYTITNTAYSEAKAPKVKTSQKLLAGETDNRSITYALSGTYNYNSKYVFVETDYVSKAKNEFLYNQFETAANNINTVLPISKDGKFTLNFNESNIDAGSYKLKLTFGTGSNADSFIAETKPVTVTLKAVKPKAVKGSYKPVTSYKMDAKAGSSVVLTGKGKNVIDNSLEFYELKNANIGGKSNSFLKYFELKNGSLALRSDLTDEDISYLKSNEGKNNLIGYVSYKVSYGDNGYGEPYTVNKTVKITIKLK